MDQTRDVPARPHRPMASRPRPPVSARELLNALDTRGYDGWVVLEQGTAIAADEPAAHGGPRRDVAQSIALINAAPTEGINR